MVGRPSPPHPACTLPSLPQAGASSRSPVHASRRRVNHVLRVAQQLKARTAAQARGRCLSLSLELCRRAQAQGIALQLVVWTVLHDPEFCDHWAVMLDDHTLVDLSHIQVDGSTRLTSRMADYPSHFVRPRRYPAAMLLPTYALDRGTNGTLISSACLFRIRWLLLSHDVTQALKCRSLLRVLDGLVSLAKFSVFHAVDRGLRALRARQIALRSRQMIDTGIQPFSGTPSG